MQVNYQSPTLTLKQCAVRHVQTEMDEEPHGEDELGYLFKALLERV